MVKLISAVEAVACLLRGSLEGFKTGRMAFWPNLAFGKVCLRRLSGKVYHRPAIDVWYCDSESLKIGATGTYT